MADFGSFGGSYYPDGSYGSHLYRWGPPPEEEGVLSLIWSLLSWLAVPAVLLLLAWLALPFLDWRTTLGRPLEASIARTSFQVAPGGLVPPAWQAPEVTLSVVIPAYNEERRLPQMLSETLAYLESRAAASLGRFSFEIIVVDDGSTDGTFSAASYPLQRTSVDAADPRRSGQLRQGDLRVLRLSQNRGKGFAVRAGVLTARGQWILMVDADGATNIRDLERLEAAARAAPQRPPSIVFGSRYGLNAPPRPVKSANRSPHRAALTWLFQTIVGSLMGGTAVKDTQCGFKLFPAMVGKHLFASLHIYRWAFDVELVLLCKILGVNIVEVPVTWVEMPGSKLNLLSGAASMLRDILLVRILYAFSLWGPAL